MVAVRLPQLIDGTLPSDITMTPRVFKEPKSVIIGSPNQVIPSHKISVKKVCAIFNRAFGRMIF
jgi:hypothetical protein